MTFGILGNFIHGGADLACGGISLAHRTLDDTLDHTGVSAFIPPALHEISDGGLGVLQRGVHDVGYTSGAVLNSFDSMTLHGRDKDIGGNLRSPRDHHHHHHHQQQPQPQSYESGRRPLCRGCKKRPRLPASQFCSDYCADYEEDGDHVTRRNSSRGQRRYNDEYEPERYASRGRHDDNRGYETRRGRWDRC